MNIPETTTPEQARGRFQPGRSGNPAGRPKGALNKTTLAAMTILDGEAEALTRKAVEMALAGDSTALRLCLERLVPVPKERLIPEGAVVLPKLSNKNANAASAEVVGAVAEGRITPTEGERLIGLLEAHRRAKAVTMNATKDPADAFSLEGLLRRDPDPDED